MAPLYFFALCCIAIVVGALSNWQLNEPPTKLAKQSVRWIFFTILGAPDVNQVSNTGLIVAHVTWSLCYEWFFYGLLPLAAVAIGIRPPWFVIAISLLCFGGIIWWAPNLMVSAPFAGGMLAAVVINGKKDLGWCASNAASVLCISCIALVLLSFPTAYATVPIVLLATAFIIIAGGNTVFGLLQSRVSRMLGSMAYSIYLLHGILLFVAVNFIVGKEVVELMSERSYWTLVVVLTPVLIVVSLLTFRLIEQPALKLSPFVCGYLREKLGRRPVIAGLPAAQAEL